MRPSGEAQRHLELELGPIPPWGTYIRVHGVTTNHGRRTLLPYEYLFEISVEWVGPPAPGLPSSPAPVHSNDLVITESLEHAKTTAKYAAAVFAKGGSEAPDLRELAAEIRRRNTPE